MRKKLPIANCQSPIDSDDDGLKSACGPVAKLRALVAAFWTAVAERSGDTDFGWLGGRKRTATDRAYESGVALRFPPHSKTGANRYSQPLSRLPALVSRHGFSLLEVLVVVSLLSLIVIALMSVFSGTQQAFRASITQTDVLEGGRVTADLIASDLRSMAPSGGESNVINGPVNFAVLANNAAPLPQTLTASLTPGSVRYNLLNFFFALGRENTKWTAVGYVVNSGSTNSLFPLYRFYGETNITAPAGSLYIRFINEITDQQWTNMSHVVDGAVNLKVRAYDTKGNWINDVYQPYTNGVNIEFLAPFYGESQLIMFSNTVPAAVDFELGVLEDRTLARAESRVANPNLPPWDPANAAQWSYLTNQIGALHLFHRRVNIPNVDVSAYK